MTSAEFRALEIGDRPIVFGLVGTVKEIDRTVKVQLSDSRFALLYEDFQGRVHVSIEDPLAHEIKSPETQADNCPVCGGSRKLASHSRCTRTVDELH